MSHDIIFMQKTRGFFGTNMAHSRNCPLKLVKQTTILASIIIASLLLNLPTNNCDVSFQDSTSIKPDLLLIVPQSFKLASSDLDSSHATNQPQNQQPPDANQQVDNHVAVVNNIKTDRQDRLIREQYPRLVLQVREAKHTQPGELVYEHVFDYFPETITSESKQQPAGSQQVANNNFILIPINLDQLSHHAASAAPSSKDNQKSHEHHQSHSADVVKFNQMQQLIVSIRPYKLDSGFGSDQIELVSSIPIPVEVIQSRTGQRSFGIVQTDKPIYKPNENVRIRTLVVNEHFRPVDKDELRIQIKNPQKIIVEEVRFPRELDAQRWSAKPNDRSGQYFLDHVFEFPPEPLNGQWSVHLLHRDPIANDTTFFEVREYALPTFEISFDLPKYVLPLHQIISGYIIAKHHYGQPIHGKAQFKFGIRESTQGPIKWVARSNIKDVDPETGKVDFRLTTERIKNFDWFPTIAGSRFVLEASVIEATSGQTELAQDSSTLFVNSPYRVSFDDSIVDFRPGMSQPLTVQLNEVQTGRPARPGLKLEATYKDQNDTLLDGARENLATEAYTDQWGRANFNLGPMRDSISMLTITIKGARTASLETPSSQALDLASLLPGDQHTLVRHESSNGWILLMNKTFTELKVGDLFESDLLIRDAIVIPQRIFYIVIARSQIILMRPLDKDGFVRFSLTEQMVPVIRIVLFALTQDKLGGLSSDSMRLKVSQDLTCGMSATFVANSDHSLESSTSATSLTQLPDTRGQLLIQARNGDTIAVTGVDSAVYTLHNRNRSESTRIIERIKRLDSGCGFGGGRNNHDVFLNAGLMLFRADQYDQQQDQRHHQHRSTLPATRGSKRHLKNPHVGSFCLTMQNQLKHLEDLQLGYRRPSLEVGLSSLDHGGEQFAGMRRGRMRRDAREKRVESIIGKYREFKLRACCRLGTFDDLPQQRNCSYRAKIVQRHMSLDSKSPADTEACAAAYLDCCRSISEELLLANVIPLLTSRRIQDSHSAPPGSASVPNLFYSDPQPADLLNVGHLDRIESETLIRRDFRETWLFELIQADEQTGLAKLDVRLPHSMTSWSISAMAVNPKQPMCLMRSPLKLITFKEIFVQLSMPYRIVQGEQIDLNAIIFNYSPKELIVVVYTYGVEGICSDAEPGERSARRLIRMLPHSSQSVIYPMIPLKIGNFPIKVLAISQQSNTSDIVERTLNVVARGRPVSDEITFNLDPLNQQRRGKRAIQTGNLIDEIDSSQGLQRSRIRLAPMRETDYIVPQTQECIVSAIGDRLGNSVQTSMLDVENLIKLPHGCGEQVMIYLGPTLYTARYLLSMDKLTGDLRWRSIRYIQSGYKRILNFRNEQSGAFSAFAGREPSIWLSSFVVKLLCQTEKTQQIANEIRVDQNVINSALDWLIDSQNPSTGNWIELNPVYHREMLGGVLKEDALTSFVTISLNECLHHSGQITTINAATTDPDNQVLQRQINTGPDKLRVALQKAEEWLLLAKYRAVKEKNPYVLALTAYALSFNKPREATDCLNELWRFAQRNHSKNQLYWTGEYSVETSGYALSALIELAPLIAAKTNVTQLSNDAQSIANWLSTRRSYTGAFESTQDTVVALEALSKLAQLQTTSPIFGLSDPSPLKLVGRSSLSCNVNISNRTRRSIEFDKHNSQIMQTIKLDPITNDREASLSAFGSSSSSSNGAEILEVVTSGTGQGVMSVKLKYNVLQEEDELCHFNIDSSIEEWRNKIPQPPKFASALYEDNGPESRAMADKHDSTKDGLKDSNELGLEEEYFTQFSRSMLSELNLVYHTQFEDQLAHNDDQNKKLKNNGNQRQQTSIRRQQSREKILRVRRAHSGLNPTVSQLQEHSDNDSTNWASKLVTNLRVKLTTWFKPTSTTPKPDWTRAGNDTHPGGPGSVSLTKRNNTRRAAQNSPPPPQLVIRPTGIPLDAKFNPLSDKLELAPLANSSSADGGRNSPGGGGGKADVKPRPVSHTSLVNQLRICVNHISSRRDSDMAVIEIGVLSGFQPNEADLKQIIEQTGSLAMKYELSRDRSMIVFYLRYIPSGAPFCLQFRLIRDSPVHNLQSGYIRVYEYYSPKRACSAFYTPLRQADPIETRCDQSSLVCECSARSTCPGIGGKMRDLGQIQEQNSTSARNKLKDLVCSNRFDFVALVQLKDVREVELGRFFKLSLKVKTDFRGNLTRILEEQKQQSQISNNDMAKIPTDSLVNDSNQDDSTSTSGTASSNSADMLTALIDSTCIRGDPLLLHLAHQNQWRKSSDKLIIFGKYSQLTRRYYKITKKANQTGQSSQKNSAQKGQSEFDDNTQISQYSTRINLDRDSIIHDLKYGTNIDSSLAAVDDLIRWLTIQVDHESWTCDQQVN